MARWRPLLLPVVFFSAHCASPPPPAPLPPAEPCRPGNPDVTLAASARSNAAPGEPGLPVQVRLYQLKTDVRLRNASFEEIWHDDKAVLQDDLLGASELTAYPGQTEHLRVELLAGSGSLAAVALFRDPQGKDWFVTFDLVQPKPPCPSSEPKISLWVDRMKIQDGQGRVEAAGSPSPEP